MKVDCHCFFLRKGICLTPIGYSSGHAGDWLFYTESLIFYTVGCYFLYAFIVCWFCFFACTFVVFPCLRTLFLKLNHMIWTTLRKALDLGLSKLCRNLPFFFCHRWVSNCHLALGSYDRNRPQYRCAAPLISSCFGLRLFHVLFDQAFNSRSTTS